MNITFIGRDDWTDKPITGGDRYLHEVAAAARECGPTRVLHEPRLGLDRRPNAAARAAFLLYLVGWYLLRLPRLRRHLLVHDLTNRGHLGLVTLAARLFCGARLVTVVQGIYHHAGVSRHRRFVETLAARLDLRAAHLVVANSEATREAVCALGANTGKVRVACPGIAPEFLAHMSEARGRRAPGELRALFVGGQCKPIKGLGTLVEAVSLLATPRLHVTFVGECDGPTCGPYVQRLRERARRLGVDSQLHFAGRVTSSQALGEVYRQHDVLVLPSLWEGYGMSVLEAMAAGLPAIVTRRGGAAALVRTGETGFHVEPGRPAELARALHRFLEDPDLASRLGLEAAREAPHLAWRWPETRAAMIAALGQAARRPGEHRLHAGERVLVIEREGLGDALVLLPALQALVSSFPDTRFDVLASPTSAGALALLPGLGAMHVARRGLDLARCALRLRRQRYDWTLVASPLCRYQLLACCIGARRRAGFDVDGRGLALDVAADWRPEWHQVERRLALARALGARPSPLRLRRSETVRADIPGTSPLVVLQARCNQPSNLWLDERWIELGERLHAAFDARFALTGSAPEAPALERLAASLPRARSLAGRLSITENLELLRRADLLVTLDTGMMHLGGLAEVSMVVLLGGRNPEHEWAPRHGGAHLVRHDVPCSPCRSRSCPLRTRDCMLGLSVDMVFEAAAIALGPGLQRAGGVRA